MARGTSSTSSVPVATPAEDPTTAIARLQSFDGSFQLDGVLRELVFGDRFTQDEFVGTVPASIRMHPQGAQIWATAIALAYLKMKAADKRGIWAGIWEKASEYVGEALQGSAISFHLLVDEAAGMF